MGFLLGGVGLIAMILLALFQIAVGFAGIENELNVWWAWGALIVALTFRLTLPLTIGTFFGAWHVLGWHPVVALLFTLPGLLFVVPGMLLAMLSGVRDRMVRRS